MFSRYALATQRNFSTLIGAGKRVGFVGLGCMGLPMSQNLKQNGYDVKGYDLMPETRKIAEEAGIRTVDSLASAATDVDYIVTALPQTAHVEEALKGEEGIFANAKQGTMICDTSTISP